MSRPDYRSTYQIRIPVVCQRLSSSEYSPIPEPQNDELVIEVKGSSQAEAMERLRGGLQALAILGKLAFL